MIYLVGAGPGDEGLITVKGLNLLKQADVIIYDHLATKSLLKYAKPQARLIYVGKQSGCHSASQAEINQLLVLEASRSNCVVRLKGGDPFMFGRGGEETAALAQARLAFEVVPGVSSAIAGPAYAGIPLTHRDYSSSVAIITGHNCAQNQTPAQWQALAQGVDTLVFLMGMSNLEKICGELIKAGLPAHTPAAVVQNATTSSQRKIVASLGEIAQKSHAAGFTAPAVIVIGQVANFGLTASWFEKLPLLGKSIVVTRARPQASELSEKLHLLGAEVLEFPVISIQPLADPAPVLKTIKNLSKYDWLVFTSANGVEYFFRYLTEFKKDARALAGCKLAAIGPGTAGALERYGLNADFIPECFVAEDLANGLITLLEKQNKNQNILIVRAKLARDVLKVELGRAGHKVKVLPVYQTLLPEQNEYQDIAKQELRIALEAGKIDALTFASSSSVDNFFKLISPNLLKQNSTICLACIGPITAQTLQKYGLACTVQPEIFTISALVNQISAHFSTSDENAKPKGGQNITDLI